MYRTSLVSLAGAAALALTPATALAHGGTHGAGGRHSQHQAKHHTKHHGAHSHKIHTHVEHFRPTTRAGSGTTAQPAPASAGTVTSFDGTTLVITLNDGSTATGTVTSHTGVSCPAPASSASTGSDPSATTDPGDDDAQGNQDDQGEDTSSGSSSEDGSSDCTTQALTPGAVVRQANLKISSAGSTWLEVALGA